MASYDNKPLDGNGLSHLWAKIKAMFALKTEVPAAGSTTPVMDGTGSTGTSTAYARADHVHPTDTSRAPLASPALTGTPTAPTAAAGTNTTQIATTAFVKAATDALDTGVTGVKGSSESTYRTGQVNITAANIGLGNVDNTADASKSVASAATLTTARTIDGVNFDGSGGIIHMATTTTHSASSSSSNYVVAQSNFVKQTGARLVICATNFPLSSAAASNKVYLNVNGTGLSPAWYKGTNLTNGMLTQGNAYEFVYDGSHYALVGELDTDTTYGEATTSADGLMSAADKTKLNGIESGANNYTHPAYDAASAAAVKVGRDATGHVVIGDALTASDVGASATGHKHAAGDVTSGTFAAARIPNLPADKIVSGTFGVARGGTGVGTLTGIIKGNGTSAFSAATASDVVTLLGSTAVNRATADASGNNIASTYLTQTSAASTYATKSEIVGLYKYKGSVATESDLPASPSTGDVYNIEAASTYGAAGANVAWNGTAWDSLGEVFQLDPLTNAEIDAICV